MQKVITFSVAICLFFPLFIQKAATQNDRQSDTAFFHRQIPVYKHWLDQNNLSSYFILEEKPLEVESKTLTLYLRFNVSGVNASINALKQLNKAWTESTGFNLEESLFQKAVFVFEVPPEDMILRVRSIRDKDGLGVDSRLKYKKIYTPDKSADVFDVSKFSFLRSEVKDSTLIHNFELPEYISIYCKLKEGTPDKQKKERQICNYIKTRAETYFGSKGGNFESSFPVSTNIINFSVKNLKGEVIEPGWVSVFDPYEKLSFSVKIVPDKSGNMKVWLVVDGKYGPGLFKPHSGDYHEMFPEYKQPLKDYTLRFIQNHIRSWLLEMPNRP